MKNLATSSSNYKNFEQALLALLDKHAPYKSNEIWANQVPYITTNLQKAISRKFRHSGLMLEIND